MTKFEDTLKKTGGDTSLSQDERAKMSRILREYMAMKPLSHSPTYSISVSSRWFTFAHRPVAAALVLVMIFGSGVSYAAENALPGDALYTVKTYVNEPARLALAAGAEAKAEVQMDLAERRIEEAATLAAEGRLDDTTEEELATAFESHADAAAEHITAADTDDDGASIELASRFETRLAAHEDVLLQIEDSDDAEHSTRLADAIRAASETAMDISAGTAAALEVEPRDLSVATSEDAVPTVPAERRASDTPASQEGEISLAETPEDATISAKVAVSLAVPSPAPTPDAKTVARMKSAAEKSLKNAQKKFKGARSLSEEASASAQTDLEHADALLTEGLEHLQADEDADAYTAFKESLRISEQASVYIKAAPNLEKARARARNFRTNGESQAGSHVEGSFTVDPIDASVTATTTSETKKDDSEDGQPDTDEKKREKSDSTSTDTDVKIHLDVSL